MNLIKLNFSYIRRRKLNSVLNTLLLALGVATIVVLLLFGAQFEESLTRDAEGIDLVVGAKGSPMQLILSSIYHVDVPTGNIPLPEARKIVAQRAVKKAIPLALGDSYRGYRIVGTTHDYPMHYGISAGEGRLWEKALEVTVGARAAEEAGLKIGDEIVSSHGLNDGGAGHHDHALRIVGILQPSGTVVDRLLLTSIPTVWDVHEKTASDEDHAEIEEEHDDGHDGEHADHASEDDIFALDDSEGKEVTTLLIQYSSPIAAAMFPRFVNSETNLQAASPAFETARLYSLLGVGLDAVRAFGVILIAAAALSVFVALYNALNDRRYDLAVMRTMGASRTKLLLHVLLEGVLMTLSGAVLGLLLGHAATEMLGLFLREAQQVELTGWIVLPEELWIAVLALAVGVITALLPAIQAYRTDIARTLAQR